MGDTFLTAPACTTSPCAYPIAAPLADWLAHYIAIEHPGWQGASDHGVSEALYLADPEGNGIEVYCDKPRTVWQLGPVGRVNMPTRRLDLQALLDVRSGQPWQGLASSTDMGHVHLQVSDLAATQQFYVQQLGFAETMTLPDSALFVSVGGYHHHLGFNTWHSRAAPPLPADGLGLASYEICLPDSQSLADVLTRVSTNSLIAPPTADSVFVRDPAGITVHLTVPKVGAAAVLSLK
jgi:catechol 2,3-dioxygenase